MTRAGGRLQGVLLRALAVLGLGVVAAELALQLAALAAPALLSRDGGRSRDPSTITILCVGDSHTYGAPLPAAESYPAQLQARLAERFPSRSFAVLNLGLPGVNTAWVANRLERQLPTYHPHVVLVWVGVNNVWNAVETDAWGTNDRGLALRRWLLHVKLFRLFEVLRHGEADHTEVSTERDGRFAVVREDLPAVARPDNPTDDEFRRGIEFDMARMTATARALRTPILFVNYPLRIFRPVPVIQATGEKLGVPVIDAHRALERAQADGHPFDELIVNAAGPHPRAVLYRYVVEEMMPHLVRALAEGHGIVLEAPHTSG